MNRNKTILAIIIMIGLSIIYIVLPAVWKAENTNNDADKPTSEEANVETSDSNHVFLKLDYIGWEHLEVFFSQTQIDALTTQISDYLIQTGRTETKSIQFLPNATTYPQGSSILLQFVLSDSSILPVTYSTQTGAFLFGKEKLQVSSEVKTYEKATDESLPLITTEEIEQMLEGGFDDTKEATNDNEETQP